jgi:hypothetical protein
MKRRLAGDRLADSLIDVQLDTGDQATLMMIEANSKQDIILSTGLFVLVIASTTCAGIFGPPLLQEERFRSLLTADSQKNVISLRIPGVSPQNQFLMVKLGFELSNPTAEVSRHSVSFSYVIIFYSERNREVRRETETFSESIVFQPRMDTSDEILFLFDRCISYDHVDLRLDVTEFGSITDAVITWACGEAAHLKFQLWIRAVFGLASMATLSIFVMRLRSVKKWTMEQKATLVLNVCSVIGINPLFVNYARSPTVFQDILNSFVFRMFTSALFVFILLVTDHILNEKLETWFFAPKIVFFFVLLIVEVAYPILYNGWEVLGVEVVPHRVVLFVNYVRFVLYGAFVAWFAVLVLRTLERLDQTEHFKLFAYTFMFVVVIAVNLSDPVLNQLSIFKNSSGLFTLHFSSLHSFVLLMIFSHWPYEFAADEAYANAETFDNAGIVHDLIDSNEGDR